ncbi:MAG TPA: NINE protein [Dehalococcoidales bacterium]|nr:NINE protein [Dehalococcoidales bacterium]
MYCRNCGQEQTAASENCPKCSQNPGTGLTYCRVCGFKVNPELPLCPKCGSKVVPQTQSSVQLKKKPANLTARLKSASNKTPYQPTEEPAGSAEKQAKSSDGKAESPVSVSPKSRTTVSVLAICPGWLGIAGIHRFYLGRKLSGIIMLLTLGGLGIWSLVDFLITLMGKMKDKDGKPVLTW